MMKTKAKIAKKQKEALPEEETKVDQQPAVVVKDPYGFEIKMANKWFNKQRTLLMCTRGVSSLHRHLYLDLFNLLPHAKKEAKVEKKEMASQIPELCTLSNCNNFIFFETRKKKDLYMWIGKNPNGPSAKLLVETITTTEELRMTGNCLKGSRPLLSFDAEFENKMHFKLLKQVFIEALGTPNFHPKSKPFYDHMYSFSIADDKIWFRHFQLSYPVEDEKELASVELIEIGPRFSLNIIKIFDGSMSGLVLYENQVYESPNTVRKQLRIAAAEDKARKIGNKKRRKQEMANLNLPADELEELYRDGYDLNGHRDDDDDEDDE